MVLDFTDFVALSLEASLLSISEFGSYSCWVVKRLDTSNAHTIQCHSTLTGVSRDRFRGTSSSSWIALE